MAGTGIGSVAPDALVSLPIFDTMVGTTEAEATQKAMPIRRFTRNVVIVQHIVQHPRLHLSWQPITYWHRQNIRPIFFAPCSVIHTVRIPEFRAAKLYIQKIVLFG